MAFGLGAILGLTMILIRRNVPESPRWLFIHGRGEEAERIVADIERSIAERADEPLEDVQDTIEVRQRSVVPFREIAAVAFTKYPRRALLGLALFVGQAFLYNAITFDLGTILSTFFKVASATVPFFILIFAGGNLLGPLTLGRLFDTVGRKPMITFTYLGAAAAATVLGLLLLGGSLDRWSFIAVVGVTFFLASAGASSAYLTVSEIFPMETRALAIAFFYAVGTGIGGITGPLLFGNLINSGKISEVATGFFIGAGVMALGGVAELCFGVRSEQRSLEEIAPPLSAEQATEDGDDRRAADGDDDRTTSPRRRGLAAAGRYRPGPGRYRWYPGMSMPAQAPEVSLDREVARIVDAVREHGTPSAVPSSSARSPRAVGGRAGSRRRCARPRSGRLRRVGRAGYGLAGTGEPASREAPTPPHHRLGAA